MPDESQLAFDVISGMLGQREADEIAELPTPVREHVRKKHPGRKPIPEHLSRVDIEIVPNEVKREGLDAFERIGEEITEVLERRSASMVVARLIKPKFVRRDRDRARRPRSSSVRRCGFRSSAASPGQGCSPTQS